jgi:chromate transporter
MPPWREVFLYFLMLGFINIGGPVAQIAMMFNHMVERRHWLSRDRFVKIMAFCHMLPGPEALQLAIYVGYLKRKVLGGIVAGLTFILPGATIMVALSWLYVKYGSLPQVNDVLFVLKPAVIGIIAGGIIKLGRAAVKSVLLVFIFAGAIVAMRFFGVSFLLILLLAGALHLLIKEGGPLVGRAKAKLSIFVGLSGLGTALADSRWFQMAWLFLKTGLFSFGGAYASIIFLERGAVNQYHWVTSGQLLDGVALSIATPGPFMLFTTFVGYIAGGVPGAVIATFFVFLPSFVFVLTGVRFAEQLQHNRFVQAFLGGASAAVVGVMFVVSLGLAREAFANWASVGIAVLAFVLVALLKRDVALVAGGAIAGGIIFAAARTI